MKRILQKVNAFLWRSRRAIFYRDMADAFRRKVGLRDFLAREEANCKMLKDKQGLSVMKRLSARYASGNGGTLRELMSGVAPASDLMLLAAVDDAGGAKPVALEKAADAVEFQQRSVKTLLTNLVTPAVAVPIVGAICIVTSEIITGIAANAPKSVWDGFNGQVRVLADVINAYWGALSAGLAAGVPLVIYLFPRWIGKYRLKADNLPAFSLYRDYNAAVVLSALAMMIGSGKTMRQSLDDLRASASPWLRWQLQRIISSLENNPTDYMAAFGRGLMPVSVRARLASLLDSAKSFDSALVSLGSSEVQRLEGSVKLSAQAVNWTLTGVLVSVAVVLSIGQMTIASALSREAEPSRLMQKR